MGTGAPTSQLLQAAKDLITPPDRWTKSPTGALTKTGDPCLPNHPLAYAFDIEGSLKHFCPGDELKSRVEGDTAYDLATRALEKAMAGNAASLFFFNLNQSHKAVLDLFDKAIDDEALHAPGAAR